MGILMDKVIPIHKKLLCKECNILFKEEEMLVNHPCQMFKAMHQLITDQRKGFKWKMKLFFMSLCLNLNYISIFLMHFILTVHLQYSFLESFLSNMALSIFIISLNKKLKQY